MNIIEKSYQWNGSLSKRKKTDYIILHHASAKTASPDAIHSWHLSNGWAGIGYHFLVRKNGSIYRGRPVDFVGAHTTNYNSISVGICFEGDFEKETISNAQKTAGIKLVSYLKRLYPNAKVKKHKDFNATDCPGKNFPFDEISKGIAELTTVNDIVWELSHRKIITNKSLWLNKCETDKNAYDLAFALANKTVNSARPIKLESDNDIAWELNYRKLVSDKATWFKLIGADKDLYWLAYKAVNMTKNKG